MKTSAPLCVIDEDLQQISQQIIVLTQAVRETRLVREFRRIWRYVGIKRKWRNMFWKYRVIKFTTCPNLEEIWIWIDLEIMNKFEKKCSNSIVQFDSIWAYSRDRWGRNGRERTVESYWGDKYNSSQHRFSTPSHWWRKMIHRYIDRWVRCHCGRDRSSSSWWRLSRME